MESGRHKSRHHGENLTFFDKWINRESDVLTLISYIPSKHKLYVIKQRISRKRGMGNRKLKWEN